MSYTISYSLKKDVYSCRCYRQEVRFILHGLLCMALKGFDVRHVTIKTNVL